MSRRARARAVADSWLQSAIDRHDFRHTRGGPEVPPHRGKRNKKLCKKNGGAPHSFKLDPKDKRYPWMTWFTYTCEHCGKTDFTTKKPAPEEMITQEEFDRRSAEVRATPEYQKAYSEEELKHRLFETEQEEREAVEQLQRDLSDAIARSVPNDKPIIIAGWWCPVCNEITKDPPEEFHIVTSEGLNYWCCSGTCRDIAIERDTDLPHHQ